MHNKPCGLYKLALGAMLPVPAPKPPAPAVANPVTTKPTLAPNAGKQPQVQVSLQIPKPAPAAAPAAPAAAPAAGPQDWLTKLAPMANSFKGLLPWKEIMQYGGMPMVNGLLALGRGENVLEPWMNAIGGQPPASAVAATPPAAQLKAAQAFGAQVARGFRMDGNCR